jgi:CrcB protein
MREILWPVFYVFIGGGAGSVFRFWVSSFIQKTAQSPFPYGTLTVNVVGSFLIGFIIAYIESRSTEFPFWRQLLIIGFLGGFTTFSSFSYDTLSLFRNNEMMAAFLNMAGNLGLCLGASFLGLWIGKQ